MSESLLDELARKYRELAARVDALEARQIRAFGSEEVPKHTPPNGTLHLPAKAKQ